MSATSYNHSLVALREFFNQGHSKPYQFRKEKLERLRKSILDHEEDIYAALHKDLHKGREEVWVTELGIVIAEINSVLGKLRKWMKPQRVTTNLLNIPSSSRIIREPLGVVLIVAPWNYPFQLLMNPLIGAIAAGNCVVAKPSEFAAATEEIMRKIITETFSPEHVLFVQGDGSEVVPAMMNTFRFDHVFYTGSTGVGRAVYKMAADKLVPVTLELGGKSPCIVAADANIDVAGRRIALSKYSNVGQMCIAPDYVLVHESKKEALMVSLKKALHQFFGDDPFHSNEYGRIINTKQFDRLISYFSDGDIIHGGKADRKELYIPPTIITNIKEDAQLMKEEIFGPLLPVISYKNNEEAKQVIARNPDPLAFYLFTQSRGEEKYWLDAIPFGGGCINNTALHFTNNRLPFGGRGNSGIGRYHGKFSFDTFSHQKAVLKTPTWLDLSIKYPPFSGKLNLFKKIIR